MDYIAEFKYPTTTDTLLIPRHQVCCCGIRPITDVVVDWLSSIKVTIDYSYAFSIIDKLNPFTGKDNEINALDTSNLLVIFRVFNGELAILVKHISLDPTLIYKERQS